MSSSAWSPGSWRSKPAAQQPKYPDASLLLSSMDRIRSLPPLISIGEVESLKTQLAQAAEGRRFVLQGGDCAERFVDCNSQSVIRKLKILLQMSLVLTYGARLPVVRIGRISGQYAKPRSKDTESVNGQELPSYRGDNVNSDAPTLEARQPDPKRLEQGYFHAVATLNFIRALVHGGFANLRTPEHWQLDFIPDSGAHKGYREIADRIRDAIDYLESLGGVTNALREVDFFTSHEGLILPYEEALTRASSQDGRAYNLGAHFLWIGERTRQLDGAHVEYFRGIANPIGVKVGPSMTSDALLALLDVLDPKHEPGRLTLITRFGADNIGKHLPALVKAVKDAGRKPLWSCDPMHGNTSTMEGYKTRSFSSIVTELSSAFEIHAQQGSSLSAVHFELTGDNVTECVGGVENLTAADLKRQYETGCDPRLNYAQSMEIAFLISDMLRRHKGPQQRARQSWD
jgi:3-deoxy-7-phosphoheptulonate synthase